MRVILASAIIGLALTVSAASDAQAPAGSTGQCKDGTYTTSESKKGACGGHRGVKEWYGSTTPAKASAATTPPAAAKSSAAPIAPAVPAPAAKTSTPPMAAAPPAGGPGQVWVNTNSKVYHCPGDRYYGKTKAGEYMTESAAKAAGSHADHGKACS